MLPFERIEHCPAQALALYLVELSFMASLFMFGYLFETRLYLIFSTTKHLVQQ
jgi:hypothetical protein